MRQIILVLFLISGLLFGQDSVTISDLPATATLNDNYVFETESPTTSYKVTWLNMRSEMITDGGLATLGGAQTFTGAKTFNVNTIFNSNVGIGTSSPLYKLHIYNGNSGCTPSTESDMVIEDDGIAYLQFAAPSTGRAEIGFGNEINPARGLLRYDFVTDKYSIRTAGAERFYIDNVGNVGIGVSDPDEKLEVTGRLHLGQTTAPGITTDKLYNVAGNLYWNGNNIGVGNYWTQSGSNIYYNIGNVGIGTSTPSQKLDVIGKGRFTDEIWVADGKGIFVNGTGSGIRFYDATPDYIALTARTGINTLFPQYMLDVNGSINFTDTLFKNGSPFKEGLWSLNGSNVYYNGGNVGIGTSTPGYKFDVNGKGRFTDTLFSNNAIFNNNIRVQGNIELNEGSTVECGGTYLYFSDDFNYLILGNADFGIGTAPSYKLDVNGIGRFSSHLYVSGNIGVGTTTPAEKLTVQWATGVDAGFFRGTTDPDITGIFMRNPNGVLYYVWVNIGGAISTSTTKP